MKETQIETDSIINTGQVIEGAISWEDQLRFLGIKLINSNDFYELLLRFIFNSLIVFLVVHYIYRKQSKDKEFYFSYIAVGAIVFLLCFLLSNVKLELGFALGLFAIFGILRYRTDSIPIKEMTYLFIVIGVSVMNALSNKKVSYAELLFTNAVIVTGLWFLEKRLMLKRADKVSMLYDKIDNIHKLKEEDLLDDIVDRTGLNVVKFEVKKIDFLRDVAELTLYVRNENGGE